MQELIDNEVPVERRAAILKHLQGCSHCRSLHQSSISDRMMIFSFLGELDMAPEQESENPVVHQKTVKAILLRLAAGVSVAAAILAFVLLFRQPETASESISHEEMVFYEYNGADLNKLWHEKAAIEIDENLLLSDPMNNM